MATSGSVIRLTLVGSPRAAEGTKQVMDTGATPTDLSRRRLLLHRLGDVFDGALVLLRSPTKPIEEISVPSPLRSCSSCIGPRHDRAG